MVLLQSQQIPSQQVSYSCEHSMSAMCIKYVLIRAGGTGPAAPVLARPIFQAPTLHF